jgi:hypothetical protein
LSGAHVRSDCQQALVALGLKAKSKAGRVQMGRGLFRKWFVLTIIWAAFVIFASSYETRPEAVTIALEAIFVPSSVILVIGLMLRWALKGFSHHN